MRFSPLLNTFIASKFVLNKFLLVRQSNEILESHPIIYFSFGLAYDTGFSFSLYRLIARLKNDHNIFCNSRVEISTTVPFVGVFWANQVFPVICQVLNRLLCWVEQGSAIIAAITPIKIFTCAITSLNFIEVCGATWCPLFVVDFESTDLRWDTSMVLTIWSNRDAGSNSQALAICEPIRLCIDVIKFTNLHLVVLITEKNLQFDTSVNQYNSKSKHSQDGTCEGTVLVLLIWKQQSKRLLVQIDLDGKFLAAFQAAQVLRVASSFHFSNQKFLSFLFIMNIY